MYYSHFDDAIKQDVFKAKTTYTNDFRIYPNLKKQISHWSRDRAEKPAKPCAPYVFTDHETYLPLRKGIHVPFNLLWKPKPILQTNPYSTNEIPEIPVDSKKDEVIKTRPRLYMSPAVSMDDVPDPEMRDHLLQHMYSSDWKKAASEAALPSTEKTVPNTTVEAVGDAVSFHVELIKPLPEKWRGKEREWDNRQMRGCVDPTVTFWTNKDPPIKCGACVNPFKSLIPEGVKKEISRLVREDKLRLAHDMSVPGYAGYKPRLSKGVTLEKTDLPVTHPFVSVTQAITKRYTQDN